jgi:peptidyl-dipeptidase Dcp
MRKTRLLLAGLLVLVCSAALQAQNPFYSEFDTPFGVPPFDEIRLEHYMPAFEEGMERHRGEIDAIVNNPEAATFQNTIEALELSGDMLRRASNVFFNMNSANTSDEMQEIAKEVAPKLSKHRDDIIFNDRLFKRVKAVYEQRGRLELTPEQDRLLEDYYKEFARNGANLNSRDKEALAKINEELSVLTLKFGENILKEDNRFELVIEDEEDLAGLPEDVRTAAAEAAAEREHEGKWVFTLHKPSMIPFLQYSDRRDLREKIFTAYIKRGDNNDELDNKEILTKIVRLRIDRANLLGYKTHAHFVLEENMAKEPEKVYELLDKLWKPALAKGKEEADALQAMIDVREGA